MITFTGARGQGAKSLRVFDPGSISGTILPSKQIPNILVSSCFEIAEGVPPVQEFASGRR